MGVWNRIVPALGPGRFGRRMARAVRAAAPGRGVTFDAAQFCLRIRGDGDEQHTLYLGNAYNDYRAAPFWRRGDVVRAYSQLPVGRPGGADGWSADQVKPKLLPKVRERYYHEQIRLMVELEKSGGAAAGPDADPARGRFLTRVMAEHLTVEVVVDQPNAVQMPPKADFDAWGLTLDAALAVARENLVRLSGDRALERVAPGVYASPWHDTHDASRMVLVPEVIWPAKVRGDHVAMVPSRNLLLVTGTEEADGLRHVAAVALKVLEEETRPMTGRAFRLVGEQWQPFLPRPGHPAYAPLRRLAMRSAKVDYDEQAAMLEQRRARRGEDVFVAAHNLLTRAGDDGWVSFAVWVDGVTDALLPEADHVNFGRIGQGGQPAMLGFAPWSRVREVCGDLMEPLDLYPPRYRVRAFPSPDRIARLGLTPDL